LGIDASRAHADDTDLAKSTHPRTQAMNRFPAPTRRLPANLAYAVAAPLCSAVIVAIAAAIALAAQH